MEKRMDSNVDGGQVLIDKFSLDFIKRYVVDLNTEIPELELLDAGYSQEDVDQIVLIKKNLHWANSLNEMQKETLGENAKLMKESQNDTFKVINKLKMSLEDSLTHSRWTQNLTMVMYMITYVIGISMIGIALYFGIQGKEILSLAFGAFGVGGIVTYFVADPPLKIQDSRSNYAQLIVGILTWFNDFLDKSGVSVGLMTNYQQMSQVAVQYGDWNRAKQLKDEFIKDYSFISKANIQNMVTIMRLMEEIAEPSNRVGIKKKEAKEQTEEDVFEEDS